MINSNYDCEDLWIVVNISSMTTVSGIMCMTDARDLVLDHARKDKNSEFATFKCDGIYRYSDT